jgi:hypothetical protein
MIAAFAIPHEPEPGVLRVADDAVRAVHMTLLKPDGSGKAGTDKDKFMIGSSPGQPLVLAPMNDLLALAITEGIEDALSIYQETGCGAWAAGSASRMPGLADTVPSYADTILICGDPDPAGRRNANELATRLHGRRLSAEINIIEPHMEVAA